jgi:hypothetical protein
MSAPLRREAVRLPPARPRPGRGREAEHSIETRVERDYIVEEARFVIMHCVTELCSYICTSVPGFL